MLQNQSPVERLMAGLTRRASPACPPPPAPAQATPAVVPQTAKPVQAAAATPPPAEAPDLPRRGEVGPELAQTPLDRLVAEKRMPSDGCLDGLAELDFAEAEARVLARLGAKLPARMARLSFDAQYFRADRATEWVTNRLLARESTECIVTPEGAARPMRDQELYLVSASRDPSWPTLHPGALPLVQQYGTVIHALDLKVADVLLGLAAEDDALQGDTTGGPDDV